MGLCIDRVSMGGDRGRPSAIGIPAWRPPHRGWSTDYCRLETILFVHVNVFDITGAALAACVSVWLCKAAMVLGWRGGSGCCPHAHSARHAGKHGRYIIRVSEREHAKQSA